jgi:uncharacterized short protein YbdD (DUF466 family)
MAITDLQISEELMTNAPSIKYRGNEGPKSPEEERMMMVDDALDEAYDQYIYDLLEQRPDATPMSKDEFKRMVIGEGMMSGGNPLPQDPTKPVNPFAPKPTGPTLPNREMAAYGGIMGVDGRRQYGVGSFFQKYIKDPIEVAITGKTFEDLERESQERVDREDELYGEGYEGVIDRLLKGEKKKDDKGREYREGGVEEYILPVIGGLTAGLFTKKNPDGSGGQPTADETALMLADLKKSANILDQKQGLAAGLNFLPDVAARKFTPAEMIETYKTTAANGGRIGYNQGNMVVDEQTTQMILDMNKRGMDIDTISTMTQQDAATVNAIIASQNQKAEGGIMDLGGLEKDYRAEGGFVPIGKAEKADDVPARLSVNEFVFTADAVRNAGGGDIDEGAKVMENVMKHLEGGGQLSRESQGMGGARDMFAVSERLSEVV